LCHSALAFRAEHSAAETLDLNKDQGAKVKTCSRGSPEAGAAAGLVEVYPKRAARGALLDEAGTVE
jgi:hypothetical protein